jgi:hypothetical protein
MTEQKETPIQEAISIVTIVAFFVGVGCFVGAMNKLPILSQALYYVATWVYALFPVLHRLHYPQIPMVAASGAVGFFVWVLGCCFATYIANWLSAGELANIDKQTARLKKNRAKIQAARRAKDGFDVR